MRHKGDKMDRSKFQFTNPELEEVEFCVNKEFDKQKFESIAMSSNTEIKKIAEDNAIVSLTLEVGKDAINQPFSILVKMSAKFVWDTSLDDEFVDNLLQTNAPAVLLSYIRPLVANMTSSSRYPVLNLPFVNFSEKK